jgi:hypothetical protein
VIRSGCLFDIAMTGNTKENVIICFVMLQKCSS